MIDHFCAFLRLGGREWQNAIGTGVEAHDELGKFYDMEIETIAH